MLGRVVAVMICISLVVAVTTHAFAAKRSVLGQNSQHLFGTEQTACCGLVEENASDHAKAVHAKPICSMDLAWFAITLGAGAAREHRVRLALIDCRRDGLPPGAPKKPPRALS